MKTREIIVVFILFVLSLSFYLHYATPVLITEDEIRDLYSAKKLIADKNLNLFNPLNDKYKTALFGPGFASFKSETEMYYSGFIGVTLFYSVLILLFGEGVFYVVAPLFGAISIIAMYFIVKRITNSIVFGVVGAVALFTMPVLIHWSTHFFHNIIFTSFILLSFLFLVYDNLERNSLLAGIFFSVAFFLRFIDATLLLLPFLLYMYMNSYKKKDYQIFVGLIGITTIILILANYLFFGEFFYVTWSNYIPYLTERYSLETQQNTIKAMSYFTLYNIIYFLNNLKNLILDYFYFLPLYFSILGLFLLSFRRKDVVIFIVLSFLILLLFYGRGEGGFTYSKPNLHFSLYRYLLPAIAFFVIPLAYLVKLLTLRMKFGKVIILPVIIILLISSLSYTINYENSGLIFYEKWRERISNDRNFIINSTSNDDIILTGLYSNKKVYPWRENVIYYPRLKEPERYKEVERVLMLSLNDKKKIYLTRELYMEEDTKCFDFLNEKFRLLEVGRMNNMVIYKIVGTK